MPVRASRGFAASGLPASGVGASGAAVGVGSGHARAAARADVHTLDVIADGDLVCHVHAFDHVAEDRVGAVKERRIAQCDVELATAGLALRVDVVAGSGPRQGRRGGEYG